MSDPNLKPWGWHTNPRGANGPRPTDRETTHARGAAEDPRISGPHFAAHLKPR